MEHENLDAQVRELLMNSERQGRTVDYGVYAGMMRRSFEQVQELRAEKFKFSDICVAYAKAGALPPGADPSSFRKAFRNEAKRRTKNLELEKRVADGRNPSSDCGMAESNARAEKAESNTPAMKPPRVMHLPNRKPGSGGGVEVRPDNTFTIRPIDTDNLPI